MKRDFVDTIPKLVLVKLTGRAYDDDGYFYTIKWDGKQSVIVRDKDGATTIADGFIAVEDVLTTVHLKDDIRRKQQKGNQG